MQTVYDILSALAGVTIVSGVSEDRAAAWMTDNSPISLGDARVALSVTLPGDRVRCGAILVVARKADPVEAVALLGASIAADQEFDHDRALTHYRGLLGRLEDQQAAEPALQVGDEVRHIDSPVNPLNRLEIVAVTGKTVTVEGPGAEGVGRETVEGVSPADLVQS